MTALDVPHAPAPLVPASPLTAAGILLAARCTRMDALSRLVAASVRKGRRYVLSYQAAELIALLPGDRWARAVAQPLLLPDDPPIWIEKPLWPFDLPERPFAVGGVGVLLSPPSCPAAFRGNAVMAVVAARDAGGDAVSCIPLDHVCPLHRGPAVPDLAAAFPLMIKGVLKPVPAPPVVPGQAEVDWMLIPIGSGTA